MTVVTASRNRMRAFDRRRTAAVAARLGITRAGLEWLGKAYSAPDGHCARAGNEIAPLMRAGYVEEGSDLYSRPIITEVGRVVVRQARGMGW